MNKIRYVLLPLSFVYGFFLWLRNFLYNKGIIHSVKPSIRTISVGNISLGGTGKTPHIEYILALLQNKNIAVLSRGYGRKSKGTFVVSNQSMSDDTGDEPLQIARKFPKVIVVVDGNRQRGIEFIQQKYPEVKLILLDDALQHRKIQAGFNILLTNYKQPFTSDFYLPAGNLRDHKLRAHDADLIVVTKCPDNKAKTDTDRLRAKLVKYSSNIAFNKIEYKTIKPLHPQNTLNINQYKKVFAITGIAEPSYFIDKLNLEFEVVKHFDYRDHYQFKKFDVERFCNFIGRFAPGEIAGITTEKDAMRLMDFVKNSNQQKLPLFYWDIAIEMNDDKPLFDNLVLDYAKGT